MKNALPTDSPVSERSFENLYIHVPYCNGKCDYCAFYSEGADHSTMEAYTEKILASLEQAAERLAPVRTIYMGGGTPVVLDPVLLEKIFLCLKKLCPETEEFSIECNPESLTEETASLLGDFATRVSAGVQTFHPHLRERIGRHSGIEKIPEAFRLLHKNRIRHLNCDLIYALPGESPFELEEDLKRAMDLGIDHLSAYSLIVEDGSVLQKRFDPGEIFLSDHAAQLEKEVLHPFLAENGFIRYEVSNYAKKDGICKHNDRIWHGERYLGMGPAACSFDGVDRFTQVSSVTEWLAGEEPVYDRISRRSRLGEIFIMGLRTLRGWEDGEFERVTEEEFPEDFKAVFPHLRQQDLMEANRISLTEKGLDYWNDVAELFI